MMDKQINHDNHYDESEASTLYVLVLVFGITSLIELLDVISSFCEVCRLQVGF